MRDLALEIIVMIAAEFVRFIIVYGYLLLASYFLGLDIGFKDAAGIFFLLSTAEIFLGGKNDR